MKRIKIRVTDLAQINMEGYYAIQIIDQTHTGDDFGRINNTFTASTLVMKSIGAPDYNVKDQILFVRGEVKENNHNIIFVRGKQKDNIVKAVKEYNEYFKQPQNKNVLDYEDVE